MLYVNETIKETVVEKEWGTLRSFNLGERGRGRREIVLPTLIEENVIEKGLHKTLTIGKTRNGRPRLNKEEDNKLFLFLSSEGGYTRRGCGYILVPESLKDQIKVLEEGNGADGDAGRIGYWKVCLLEVPIDQTYLVKVVHSGATGPYEYILVHEGEVRSVNGYSDLADMCDALGIDIPNVTKIPDDGQYSSSKDGVQWLMYQYCK